MPARRSGEHDALLKPRKVAGLGGDGGPTQAAGPTVGSDIDASGAPVRKPRTALRPWGA
ncbi:hypothetical protein [Burkholderia sp. JKS000303]|uniref:hypothetical protein n=1 Tax=Burkholderia sp. JKS000303 TaxID=1938747 RepID=UPI000C01EAF2|nr:hypothetical protein [Burkholderia sp. JKS000303]PFH19073.1 hypothetical protein BX604_5666 [Burkholderia sp. JKS000303]